MRRMKLVLGCLIFFEIADGVLTNLLVRAGIAREGNPLMRPLAGSSFLVVIKLVGVLVCVVILLDMYRRSPVLARWAAACLATLCAFVVLWNLGLLVTA